MIDARSDGNSEDLPGPKAVPGLYALNLVEHSSTALRRHIIRYLPGAAILRSSGRRQERLAILSGWVCEIGKAAMGRRPIYAFVLSGEVVDLAMLPDRRALIALTRVDAVPVSALLPQEPAARAGLQAQVARILQAREDRVFDQILRLGRMNGRERLLDLLLEFRERLAAAGLVRGDGFRLPLTQEVLANALGLSRVHLNRALRELREEGAVRIDHGEISVLRPQQLARAAWRKPQATAPRLQPAPSS